MESVIIFLPFFIADPRSHTWGEQRDEARRKKSIDRWMGWSAGGWWLCNANEPRSSLGGDLKRGSLADLIIKAILTAQSQGERIIIEFIVLISPAFLRMMLRYI